MVAQLSRAFVKNYKSLAKVGVELGPFTVLVGRNGSGKSNFIDAISFVRDCLAESIERAFRQRRGVGAVLRRSGGHPTHLFVRLDMQLHEELSANYAVEIAAKPGEPLRVAHEKCIVRRFMEEDSRFELRDGAFLHPIDGVRPSVAPDRLALYAASGTPEFRPVYDFLTKMRFYSISPDRLRELQEPDPGEVLEADGGNAAAVLERLEREAPERYERICRLLAAAVEGVESVSRKPVGGLETVVFRQRVGLEDPWSFDARDMSDGTLRLLGLLLAAFQPGAASLIAIEEPSAAVHPAIAKLVLEVLRDASRERQVLVTTHSPDVLDVDDLDERQIRVVSKQAGKTVVAPLARSSRDSLRNRLSSAGQLLRSDALIADYEAAERKARQRELFPAGGTREGSSSDREDPDDGQ